MNRFNTGNLKNKILKITLISLLIFSYYFIIKNSNFIENITKDIEDKYSNKSINIEKFKTEVVYKSLNKIIDESLNVISGPVNSYVFTFIFPCSVVNFTFSTDDFILDIFIIILLFNIYY